MKTTPQFDAHINQMADEDNCLRVDNVEIKGRISKNGKYFVAESATEFFVEDTDTETKEWDETVPLKEALDSWKYPIGKVKLIEGKLPVLCSDKVWRPLVWIDEDGNGNCFLPS